MCPPACGARGLKPHLLVLLCGTAVRFLDIRHAFALQFMHALREMVHRRQMRKHRVRVAVRRRLGEAHAQSRRLRVRGQQCRREQHPRGRWLECPAEQPDLLLLDVQGTDSIEGAIGEMERRRKKQVAHNEEHGITPRTIVKPVRELLDLSSLRWSRMTIWSGARTCRW